MMSPTKDPGSIPGTSTFSHCKAAGQGLLLAPGRTSNQIYLAPEPDPQIQPKNRHRRRLDPGDQFAKILAAAAEQAVA